MNNKECLAKNDAKLVNINEKREAIKKVQLKMMPNWSLSMKKINNKKSLAKNEAKLATMKK